MNNFEKAWSDFILFVEPDYYTDDDRELFHTAWNAAIDAAISKFNTDEDNPFRVHDKRTIIILKALKA